MPTYQTPGIYKEEVFPALTTTLRTGVPLFLGYVGQELANRVQMLTQASQFGEKFGAPAPNNYLTYAVRGFFENDGQLCYVMPLDDTVPAVTALRDGLAAAAPLDTIDLVCAPDIMRPRQLVSQGRAPLLPPLPEDVQAMQGAMIDHCNTLGDRFALLDPLPDAGVNDVQGQRQGLGGQGLGGINGALYYPWVRVTGGPVWTGGLVPPCGHVAGIYARSDQRIGVHKAPANEVLAGVLDLAISLTDLQQAALNPLSVNCLRAFPGRGIRVWGARTLSGDPAWTYVNVRRLFLTVGRWIERNMTNIVFEPNDFKLWARISRELTGYFNTLLQHDALQGRIAQEAFYVKCDAETNPPAVREAGLVITEIGLAPAVPGEFIVVRIIYGASGITIQ